MADAPASIGEVAEEAHQHRQVVFEPELVVRRSSQARARGRS